VIIDMWWATTSCSSRAIRARSSTTDRSSRSAALTWRSSASCTTIVRLPCTKSPASTATTHTEAAITTGGQFADCHTEKTSPIPVVTPSMTIDSLRSPRLATRALIAASAATEVTAHGHGSSGEAGRVSSAVANTAATSVSHISRGRRR
jgi:hypothetical protein